MMVLDRGTRHTAQGILFTQRDFKVSHKRAPYMKLLPAWWKSLFCGVLVKHKWLLPVPARSLFLEPRCPVQQDEEKCFYWTIIRLQKSGRKFEHTYRVVCGLINDSATDRNWLLKRFPVLILREVGRRRAMSFRKHTQSSPHWWYIVIMLNKILEIFLFCFSLKIFSFLCSSKRFLSR